MILANAHVLHNSTMLGWLFYSIFTLLETQSTMFQNSQVQGLKKNYTVQSF